MHTGNTHQMGVNSTTRIVQLANGTAAIIGILVATRKNHRGCTGHCLYHEYIHIRYVNDHIQKQLLVVPTNTTDNTQA